MCWVEKLVLGTQFHTIDAKAEHEGGCEGRNAANVFITLDGIAKFLCKVVILMSIIHYNSHNDVEIWKIRIIYKIINNFPDDRFAINCSNTRVV